MTSKRVVPGEVLRELIDRGRLSEDEVARRLRQTLDPEYWKRLNPCLSVNEQPASDRMEREPLDLPQRSEILRKLGEEGYFQTGPLLSQSAIGPMRECVDALRNERWPPVFAFVYDQFWQVFRTPSLAGLLSEALGREYRQDSRIWCFYIAPIRGSSGFSPHIDGFDRPNRITIWIPLTDATLENGCMYVAPQHLVPEAIGDFSRLQSIGLRDLCTLLQSVRALPAPAGSVLCWNSELIHWGSTCGQAENPRISISVEFLGKQEQPKKEELPLLDGSLLPSFEQRLHAIGKGILDYTSFEPQMLRYRDFAKKLAEASKTR